MERTDPPAATPGEVTRRTVLRQLGGAGMAAMLLAGGGGLGEADAQPATPASEGTNLFEFTGSGVTIAYAAGSLDGRPRFTYRAGTTTVDAGSDEIAVQASPLGRLVTVVVDMVLDLRTTSLTLLLPEVNPTGTSTPVETLAILTTARTTEAGPRAVRGAIQMYRALPLTGTARAVEF